MAEVSKLLCLRRELKGGAISEFERMKYQFTNGRGITQKPPSYKQGGVISKIPLRI